LGNWAQLIGEGFWQVYQPSLLQEQAYVSRVQVWQNNFANTQEISLGGQLWAKWGMGLKFYNTSILNHTYFTDSLRFEQLNGLVNLFQAEWLQRNRLGRFDLENSIVWQQAASGGDYLPLPQWHWRHSLAWEAKVFKTMRLRIGANMRWWSSYRNLGYLPMMGQFLVQGQRQPNTYPVVDVFASFKIFQFRFFVNAENLMQVITGENYFSAWRYPVPNFLVRFGVSWRLLD
jgi:hypothetical protein